MAELIIYTDGAARGNPGKGGYGAILMFGEKRLELSAGFRYTTNNRMELLAVIEALKALKKNHVPILIFTDSKYIVDSVTKGWLNGWIKTDFKGGKKNKDLWTAYYHLAKNFQIKFRWVKGHADNPFNNRCDELATQAADGGPWLTDTFYEQENKK